MVFLGLTFLFVHQSGFIGPRICLSTIEFIIKKNNMLEVKEKILPEDIWYIKCPYKMTPKFLVIHNTANDASAQNERDYMANNGKEVSFHYMVDNKEVIQAIPESRNAWHAADGGKGNGNRNGIAIEICYSKSGGAQFDKAEENAAQLAAQILFRYGWDIDALMKHQDFKSKKYPNGKYCPHRTLDRGWERFVGMVEAKLEKLKEPEPEIIVESTLMISIPLKNGDPVFSEISIKKV